MPLCKFCSTMFHWGQRDDKFVPLVPVGDEGDLDRTYQDEDGLLRVEHAAVCNRGPAAVRVTRLAKKIKASDILALPPMGDFVPAGPSPRLGPNEKMDPKTGEITFTIKRKKRVKGI